MRPECRLLVLVLAAGPLSAPGTAEAMASVEPAEPVQVDAETALREGNRRFREGRLEAAVEAYRAGLEPGGEVPVLAYNLGTALHRLGRLPEAILWYRRAQAAGSTDPWLAENLERARSDLAAARRGPPAPLAPALLHPWLPRAVAALLAWAGLVTALVAPPRGRAVAAVLLTAALAAWAGAALVRRLGPQPAVLLSACPPALPAGSEVWVVAEPSGAYRVSGSGDLCPAATVGLLDTRGRSEGVLAPEAPWGGS